MDADSPYGRVVAAIAGCADLHPRVHAHETDKNEPSLAAIVIAALCDTEIDTPSRDRTPDESDADIVKRLLRTEYTRSSSGGVQPRSGPQFTLERQHWHERDARIIFDDTTHSYHLADPHDGTFKRFPGSVSSAYGAFFEHFDGNSVVRRHWQNWLGQPTHKNHAVVKAVLEFRRGLEVAEPDQGSHDASEATIQCLVRVMTALWNRKNRLNADSDKGTQMHAAIEWYLNGTPLDELPSCMLEHRGEKTMCLDQFSQFCEDIMRGEGLRPYRTEWSVYDEDSYLSGQIDSVMIDADGGLHMVDWKRCQTPDLGPDQRWFRKGKPPCHEVPDNDFGHYTMQQNIYKAIVEKNYGLKIKSMRLAHFHPYALTSFRMVDVPDCAVAVQEIMAIRSRQFGDQPAPKKPRVV